MGTEGLLKEDSGRQCAEKPPRMISHAEDGFAICNACSLNYDDALRGDALSLIAGLGVVEP